MIYDIQKHEECVTRGAKISQDALTLYDGDYRLALDYVALALARAELDKPHEV